MAYRRVICLAFSRREGANCFAGIELDTGMWVRPVNSDSVGALYDHQCFAQTDNSGLCEPTVLDIVDIDLLTPSPKVCQPENWIMGKGTWRLVGHGQMSDLTPYVSSDPELFRGYDRSVSAQDLKVRPPKSSLVVIAPEQLSWYAERDAYGRKRLRGRFVTCGTLYDLPLTDHLYDKELRDIPLDGTRKHDYSRPILFTISLSDVWNKTGKHYKLIAGVIQ